MELLTSVTSWYEISKVGDRDFIHEEKYYTVREAKMAIREMNRDAVKAGSEKSEYNIMFCNCVRTFEHNGDIVSETTVKTREM